MRCKTFRNRWQKHGGAAVAMRHDAREHRDACVACRNWLKREALAEARLQQAVRKLADAYTWTDADRNAMAVAVRQLVSAPERTAGRIIPFPVRRRALAWAGMAAATLAIAVTLWRWIPPAAQSGGGMAAREPAAPAASAVLVMTEYDPADSTIWIRKTVLWHSANGDSGEGWIAVSRVTAPAEET